MKSLLVGILACFSTITLAEDRFLHYEYSPVTYITITNVECPFGELKDEFHHASYVTNVLTGFRIFGCFKPTEHEMIRLQWWQGDFSEFPANAFLVGGAPAHVRYMLENPTTLKPTL